MYASNTVSTGEMAGPLSRPYKSEENRHYWKIQEVLPKSGYLWGENINFKLHNELWVFSAFYSEDKRIRARITECNRYRCFLTTAYMFDIRAGICEESQEVIAISEGSKELIGEYILEKIPIRISELETIMQENKLLYFFIEITRNNKKKTGKRKIEADFEGMLIGAKNSDVTIEVNSDRSRNFKCHRNVLAARSPVFSAMMQHDMIEKTSGIVSIVDAEPAIFQDFLLYLYTGNEKHLNRKNIIELYKLGDKYIVEDLKSICVEHMKENISTENLFEFFLLSQQHNESKLTEFIIDFFVENSKEIVKSEKWIEFLKKNPVKSNMLITAVTNALDHCRSVQSFLYAPEK